MARDHARIGTSIWSEPSIRGLTRLQQQAYLLVLSQPDLSRCGVVAYRPRRWATTSHDGTEKAIRKDCASLTLSRHVVIDEETEELFARTYVRHDRILAQPNVVAALVSDYALIASPTIRLAFLRELRRLWSLDLSDAERGGWLLTFGHYPTEPPAGDKAEWPATMTPAALGRIRKAVGAGLIDAMTHAIRTSQVPAFDPTDASGVPEPFTEAFPEPQGEPFTEALGEPPYVRADARVPARSPSPSPVPDPVPLALADARSSINPGPDGLERELHVPRPKRRPA